MNKDILLFLQKSRDKLVNLSNRNRLIKFNLKAKRSKHIDLVDISLEEVWEQINSEDEVSLRFLPEPPQEDDSTDTTLGIEEIAELHRIDPSLELSVSKPEEASKSKSLQMLHHFESGRRLATKLREDARLASEEKGVETLHCALGFLEWFEAKHSDIPVTSPLLLAPLELSKVKASIQSEYVTVKGVESGSDGWVVNPSLRLKLKNDFGIELPGFTDKDTVSSFLKSVQELLVCQPKWSIVPRAVIANFAFPKISLYEDLDPERWQTEEGNLLLDNPLIHLLLTGSEREPNSEEQTDLEEDSVPAPIPGLVFDADSSQLKAIERVMSGENLVVEGPPGTGKSQTIANLICAALADGRRVLFIADKKAAIDVVHQRLTCVGLDPFCLNLHENSSQAKNLLYKKLEKRLDLESSGQLHKTETYFKSLPLKVSEIEQKLNEYYSTLTAKPTDTSACVADIMWSSLKSRKEYAQLPEGVRRIEIQSALDLTSQEVEETQSILSDLETLAEELDFSETALQDHPLYGLNLTEMDYFAQDEFRGKLDDLKTTLTNMKMSASSLELFTGQTIEFIVDCERLARTLSKPEADLDFDLLHRLSLFENLNKYATHLELIAQILPFLQKTRLNQPRVSELTTTIKSILGYSAHFNLEESDEIRQRKSDQIKNDREAVEKACSFVEQALPHLPATESQNWASIFFEISLILEHSPLCKASAVALLDEKKSLFADDARWQQLVERTVNFRKLQEELESFFVPASFTSPEIARELELELSKDSYFSWFSPKRRRALGQLREMACDGITLPNNELIAHLSQLNNWQRLRNLLQEDCSLLNINLEDVTQKTDLTDAYDTYLFFEKKAPHVWKGLIENKVKINKLAQVADESFTNSPVTALQELNHLLTSRYAHLKSLSEIDCQSKKTSEKLRGFEADLRLLGFDNFPGSTLLKKVLLALEAIQELSELDDLLKYHDLDHVLKSASLIEEMSSHASFDFLKSCSKTSVAEFRSAFQALQTLAIEIPKAQHLLTEVGKAGGFPDDSILGERGKNARLSDLICKIDEIQAASGQLPDWINFQNILKTIQEQAPQAWGLVFQLIEEKRSLSGLSELFYILLSQSRARQVMQQYKHVLGYGANGAKRQLQSFQSSDTALRNSGKEYVKKALLARHVPRGSRFGPRRSWTGVELIKHEQSKQKRRIAPRKLLARAIDSLKELTPCFMMSPLTVAQYLAPEAGIKFDLVLIDEASQMRPEEALSAIARGAQLVVVGDSKQLPPTSFFGSTIEDDEVSDEDAMDNESILDMGKATLSSHGLRWHYRSRHDSLIHFSNRHFYDGRLIICPSSKNISEFSGIHLLKTDGIYQDRRNHIEAQAVVSKAIHIMKSIPDNSLGIVAMNREQQELITDLLYQAREDEQVDSYLENWDENGQRCFVKNLENVQGDERDIILISTVYGPQVSGGTVLRRFGPINGKDGARRLNVLATRARNCMYVITSLKPTDVAPPEQLDSLSLGAQAFAKFLEYAGSRIQGSCESFDLAGSQQGDPDSPFEEFVGQFLDEAGYEVHYQVGQSGFRIDIGLKHPNNPYGYIAGIECDGATYHSHKSARDRDRLRQEILEDHGWSIYRIWSTDWFNRPDDEKEKLLRWLAERAPAYKQVSSEAAPSSPKPVSA